MSCEVRSIHETSTGLAGALNHEQSERFTSLGELTDVLVVSNDVPQHIGTSAVIDAVRALDYFVSVAWTLSSVMGLSFTYLFLNIHIIWI